SGFRRGRWHDRLRIGQCRAERTDVGGWALFRPGERRAANEVAMGVTPSGRGHRPPLWRFRCGLWRLGTGWRAVYACRGHVVRLVPGPDARRPYQPLGPDFPSDGPG